jgi:Basophilic leukemia-expressed protein Bles03
MVGSPGASEEIPPLRARSGCLSASLCSGNVERLPSEEAEAFWLFAEAPPALRGGAGGKWMVFVYTTEVDASWAVVREATEQGLLGPASKVSTARENPNATASDTKVIIVYTRDAHDREDVGRVLGELRRLGFSARLNYKLDDDTRGGVYGRGASLYTSPDGTLEFHTPKSRRR